MDALNVIASATQIVSSMIGTIAAFEQASRDFREAPKKIQVLEEFVSDLDNLVKGFKQMHAHKLGNPQLERQVQSLTGLIGRLHMKVVKARRMAAKGKVKSFTKVVWSSMAGDPLSRLIQSMRDDLNWWLELQKVAYDVEKVIGTTAENTPSTLKVSMEQGYPVSSKSEHIRRLLEQDDAHRVILIVGLSGMGKSCLARQIANNPPPRFVHGAVELAFGRWCSRAACGGSRIEYQKRLAKRFSRFLMQINFLKKVKELDEDLEDVCCFLQTALCGKSILILLDDVWEQDIVDRFAKLYDNSCRYLVTTRNEAVYEITEAEKVEICKEDIKEISKEILCYHSLLTDEELPSLAETLLERCGHHPLTVAVMGKALRKETWSEKWEKAINNLSTYAACEPGPVSYVNEKEAENTLTIFGSLEFSLEAMPKDSQKFFIVLSAISWAEPVPESCLDALWLALGQESMYPLVVSKLVEGSLLIKTYTNSLYHVHDMVSLYLDNKIGNAIQVLLVESAPNVCASVAPWLYIFGKEVVQIAAAEKISCFLSVKNEKQVVITLETAVHALMASKSISEFEASRESLSTLLGPQLSEIISFGPHDIVVAACKAVTMIFSEEDYYHYIKSLEDAGSIEKLTMVLQDCRDPPTQTAISVVAAKLAEYGSTRTISKVLPSMPMKHLSELLSPEYEQWHEYVFMTLMSLLKVGKSIAAEMVVGSGVTTKLLLLLEKGSEVSQHHAIVTLKAIYELGVPLELESLLPSRLSLLPWHVRLSLERFIKIDSNRLPSPKLLDPENFLQKIPGMDQKQLMQAVPDLIAVVEKANDPAIRNMILKSQLIERLSFWLQCGDAKGSEERSECVFLLMKLAFAGGEPFVLKFLDLGIILELVQLMLNDSEDLQDSAYNALHQIVFGTGGALVLKQFLKSDIIEKLGKYLDRKSSKIKEVALHFIVDLVELGTKPLIEKMFATQIVERLVNVEKYGGKFSGSVVRFLKGLDMCKNLTAAERAVMKQQAIRKVRTAARGQKIEARLTAAVDAFVSEGARGGSSGRRKK